MSFYVDEQHKLYFIPSLIYGVIRVSLIPVQDIRTAMIRVLCDMIYVINKHKDNLSIFENEFVTVMDKFANEPLVDKNFKEYLINAYVLKHFFEIRLFCYIYVIVGSMIFVKQRNFQEMVRNLLI